MEEPFRELKEEEEMEGESEDENVNCKRSDRIQSN